MHFQIHRASDWKAEKPPVPSAVKGDGNKWFVDLRTLDDLMRLVDEAGAADGLIVNRNSIWVYDDYME